MAKAIHIANPAEPSTFGQNLAIASMAQKSGYSFAAARHAAYELAQKGKLTKGDASSIISSGVVPAWAMLTDVAKSSKPKASKAGAKAATKTVVSGDFVTKAEFNTLVSKVDDGFGKIADALAKLAK